MVLAERVTPETTEPPPPACCDATQKSNIEVDRENNGRNWYSIKALKTNKM